MRDGKVCAVRVAGESGLQIKCLCPCKFFIPPYSYRPRGRYAIATETNLPECPQALRQEVITRIRRLQEDYPITCNFRISMP